jgi:hypothetical protein
VIPVAPKRMTADFLGGAGRRGALVDHPPRIRLAIGLSDSTVPSRPRLVRNSQPLRSSASPAASIIPAQSLSQRVLAGHSVLLAAFFVPSDRPSGAARPQVFDLHIQRRANSRERVGEGRNQCAVPHIAQSHVRYRLQQLAPMAALEHRRLAGFHDLLRTADRTRVISRSKGRDVLTSHG